jgi:hypothetical protein
MDLIHLYNVHIAVSYRDDYGMMPHAFVFGVSHKMPVCDAQDTVHAVASYGILPAPCSTALHYFRDKTGATRVKYRAS